ncbi:MAG: hypothetical protein KDA84_15080 [Planctomycetaceae bacterium]|nr:hypothetical protein [Planctomycetaceae bacterium]
MSSVFRIENHEPIEASGHWRLDQQIEEVSDWLQEEHNAERVRGSILDIGFNSRLHGSIAMQGEVLPTEFLRQLVSLDITLWLSIYRRFTNET